VKAGDRHFEHVFKYTVFAGFELLASFDSLKCQISMFSFDFNTNTMMKIVIFIVIVLHGSVVVRIKVQWIHCIPLDSEKCHD